MFCVEKFFGSFARQILDYVYELATAVVTFARITFRILVRENAARCFQHSFRSEILARDQFQSRILPIHFVLNRLINLGVNFRERPRHALLFVHAGIFRGLI